MDATPAAAHRTSAEDTSTAWPLSLRSSEAAVLAQLIRAQALVLAEDEHSQAVAGLSQNELENATGLAQASVSRALKELHARGIITLSGVEQVGRGPATKRWCVDSTRYYVIGVNLRDDFGAPGRLHGVAMALDGRDWHSDSQNLEPASVDDVRSGIKTLVERLRKLERPGARLIGIGLSLGGQVLDGRVVRSYNLGWADEVDLREDLHHALSGDSLGRVAVIVENNANSFAASLNPSGGPAQWRVTVIVDHRGIGSGLYLNDRLWTGDFGKAGEIGHMPTFLRLDSRGCTCPEDGPFSEDCRFHCFRCGKHGCLETISTPQAIVRALEEDTGRKITTIGRAAELLEQGDRDARRAFEFAGRALGYALANLALTVDPESLRLYGRDTLVDPDTASGKVYLAAMNAVLDRHSFSEPRMRIETHPHQDAETLQEQAAFAVAGDVVQRFLRDQI